MAEERALPLSVASTAVDLSSLTAWDCDIHIPAGEYDRLGHHPRLEAGLRALNASSLDAMDADPTLLGIFKDGGRYVSAMWAIFLHVGEGLTLQSLKALCAQSGLLSPGRARAMLLYMRYLRYVEPVREGRSPTRYMPTPRFKAAWLTHMRCALEAVCAIEPTARTVVNRLGDPAVFTAVVRTQGESLFLGTQTHDLDNGLFRVFINRHAGGLILRELLAGGLDGAYPPTVAAIPAAVELARRYQVSRIQIRRVLSAAEKEGLVRPEPDNRWRLDDDFRALVTHNHTLQLRHLMLSAARAAASLPPSLLSATGQEQF